MEVLCQFWKLGNQIRPEIISEIKVRSSSGFVILYSLSGRYLDTLDSWLKFISENAGQGFKTEDNPLHQILIIRKKIDNRQINADRIKDIIKKWQTNLDCFIEEIEFNANSNYSEFKLHPLRNGFDLFVQRTTSSVYKKKKLTGDEILILKFVFLAYDGKFIDEFRKLVLDYEPDSNLSTNGAEFIVKRYNFDNL